MINKNIIALGFVSFFTDMASAMVTTLLPIFVVYVLKEDVDKLGLIIAISTFVSYFFRFGFGYLSDKLQVVKPFVVLGYCISALAKPMIAFSHTYTSVMFLRSFERMGKAIRSASKDSLLSSYSKDKSHGKTFGFHKMMDIAGELSGAFIIYLVFVYVSKSETIIRDIFMYTAIPGIIATIIAILFVKDVKYKKNGKITVLTQEDKKLYPVLFVYFIFIFFMISEQFFILRAKNIGYTLESIPLFIMLFTLIQTIVSYYGGILSDKIGLFYTFSISFVFGILSVCMLKINLWVSFSFLGLFTVLSLNAMRAYISEHSISKGYIFGIFYAGIAVFSSLGALVIGYIWKFYGFDYVYLFSMIGMISIFIFYIFKFITPPTK